MAKECCSKGDCSTEFCKSAAPKSTDETPDKMREVKKDDATPAAPKGCGGGCNCG